MYMINRSVRRIFLLVIISLSIQATIVEPVEASAPNHPDEANAASDHECSLTTLNGTYLFRGQGVLLGEDGPLPYAEAGLWTLDGAGNANGVYSGSLNGEAIANAQSFNATYQVVTGCAYTAFSPLGAEENVQFDLYTTPTGDMITYYSAGFSGTMWRQEETVPEQHTADIIENAMSAAPNSISAEAAVWAWPTDDNPEFAELRAGTNNWTCLPDDPLSPTNDPMCLDAQWVEWIQAIVEGRDPEIATIGWAYMLQGGSAASDSDPTLMEPPEGEDWLVGPPHLMVIAPDKFNVENFPTHRDTGEPYIMWAGTPYEHFMIPVQFDLPLVTNDPVANALSAAPDSVSANAAVWAWPTEDNPTFTELRADTNSWTCLPDDPLTPTNDPMCLDTQWTEWIQAIVEGRDPEVTDLGFSYMLQGGSGASNADPAIMEPDEGEEWLIGPPHVMLISPEPLDTDLFPSHRSAGEPYIMWAGTPYEHFMAPTVDMDDE